MNLVRDAEGSILFGAVDVNVYYTRFVGKLSARLGAAHVADMQQSLESGTGIGYFADSSELASYDLLARSAFVRLLLSHRRRFAELVILTAPASAAAAAATGQSLAATVGEPVEMLDDRHEFERRLTSAAPRALSLIRGASSPQSGVVPIAGTTSPPRAKRS